MKNIFKSLFGRKHHIAIDCETAGLNGFPTMTVQDAAGVLREIKVDYNKLTDVLHAMPVKATNLDEPNPAVQNQRRELWEWNYIARTIYRDLGFEIKLLEQFINQQVPSLKDVEPTIPVVHRSVNEMFERAVENLTK